MIVYAVVAGALWGCTNGAAVVPGGREPLTDGSGNEIVAAPPMADLRASLLGSTSSTNELWVDVADTLNFVWIASNADQAQSWYHVDSPDNCTGGTGTGPFPWTAATLQGSTSEQMMSCRAGHTYTITYLVENSKTGLMTKSDLTIHVNAL